MSRKGAVAVLLVLMLGVLVWKAGTAAPPRAVDDRSSFNVALWEHRGFDVVGQAMLILAGAFAVVVLFREGKGHA